MVDIQLARFQERLTAEYHIELALTAQARDWLATQGYDIEYGARPLKRLIRRELEDQLALRMVVGEVHAGERVLIDVDTSGDRLLIKNEKGK